MPVPARFRQTAEPLGDTARAARDREWVARIRRGDAQALEAMFRAYKNDLGAYVTATVRSREAAEEIIQDLFLRIWSQRELWDVPGPLNTYLFRAARNRAVSYLRHERVDMAFREEVARAHATEALSEGRYARATPDENLDAQDLRDAIAHAIDALPERCREVFRLNREHHLSYADVAQVLEISVKTVEVQMGRALTALRRQLTRWRTTQLGAD